MMPDRGGGGGGGVGRGESIESVCHKYPDFFYTVTWENTTQVHIHRKWGILANFKF